MNHLSLSQDLSLDSFGTPRPALLMCAPSLYTVNYVINPWMDGNVGACSQARAMAQWHRLYNLLAQFAQVHLVEPAAGWPDMVFTANAGLIRDEDVVLSSFLHPERQGEEPHFRRWFAEAGYNIIDLPRDTAFEGEGDALFSSDETRLWVGHGTRTNRSSHGTLAALWDVEVTSLRLVDPRFYHLDTCFAPLANGYVLYFPDAFDTPSRAAIEAFYAPEQRIAVNEADALQFACNVVNLGRTLVLNHISPALQTTLEERGFHVLQTPLDEFLKAGGAAKCLVLKLSSQLHMPQMLPNASTEGTRAQAA